MTRTSLGFALLFLSALTVGTFWNSFSSDFVDLDDDVYLTENPLVMDLSPAGIKNIFFKSHEDLHKPLVFLTFAVEYRLFGLNPHVYHTTNIVLHLLNAWLVFGWLMLLSRKYWPALIAAALFAAHPLRAESVSWISERKDVLYALFFLLALISYTKYVQTSQRRFRIGCLVVFVLSMLAKPMAVTMPFILPLIDFYHNRRLTKNTLLEKAPYLLISLGWSALSILAVGWGREKNPITLENFIYGPFNGAYGLLFYLYKLIVPTNLFIAYTHPLEDTLIHRCFYFISPLLIGCFGWWLWEKRRSYKTLFFACGYYLLVLLPVLQVLPTKPTSIVNDHYTYVAYVPLIWLAADWTLRNRLFLGLWLMVITVSAGMTFRQTKLWTDSTSLWTGMVRNFPKNALAYNHRGNTYIKQGQYQKALEDFNSAITIKPHLPEGYNNRGVAHSVLKHFDYALRDFDTAQRLEPDFAPTYINRGNMYGQLNQREKAIQEYRKAIKFRPSSEAYNNLANEYLLLRDYAQAEKYFSKSIQWNTKYVNGYIHRGKVRAQLGRFEEAVADFSSALKYDPKSVKALYHRGNALSSLGKHSEALADFTKALVLNSDDADILSARGTEYVFLEQMNSAIADFNRAIELNPMHSDAYNNRGCYLIRQQKIDEAIGDFTRAIELNPKNTLALNNRGNVYLLQKKDQKALADFNEALKLDPGNKDALKHKARLATYKT